MRDEEQVRIVLCVHGLVCQALKIDQQAKTDVGLHHVREFIPDDQKAFIVAMLGQFLLHLEEPGAEFLALQADVDAGVTQHVLYLYERAGILGGQVGQEFVHRGRKGRQLGVLLQDEFPEGLVILDVRHVIVEIGLYVQVQTCL